MTLETTRVKMVQDNSKSAHDYLVSLAIQYPYRIFQDETAVRREIEKIVQDLWIAYADGIPAGCAFLSYIEQYNIYTFDAYHDRNVTKSIDNRVPWVYDAGKMLVPYILNHKSEILWSWHDVRNRAATIMLKKLGFTDDGIRETIFGKYQIFYTRRDLWESKQRSLQRQ